MSHSTLKKNVVYKPAFMAIGLWRQMDIFCLRHPAGPGLVRRECPFSL